jgi:hypothetical protein
MAEIRLVPAYDQDGTQLWQHESCWGVQPASNLNDITIGKGDASASTGRKCPLCGERGFWFPLYRPAGQREVDLIDRTADRIEAAARKAVVDLNRALGGV